MVFSPYYHKGHTRGQLESKHTDVLTGTDTSSKMSVQFEDSVDADEPGLVVLKKDGDLVLILATEDDANLETPNPDQHRLPPIEFRVLVQSDFLIQASPVFARLLTDGWFAQGLEFIRIKGTAPERCYMPLREKGGLEMVLAARSLLEMTHFKFDHWHSDQVLSSFDRVYNIADVAQKYSCYSVVNPWIRYWSQKKFAEVAVAAAGTRQCSASHLWDLARLMTIGYKLKIPEVLGEAAYYLFLHHQGPLSTSGPEQWLTEVLVNTDYSNKDNAKSYISQQWPEPEVIKAFNQERAKHLNNLHLAVQGQLTEDVHTCPLAGKCTRLGKARHAYTRALAAVDLDKYSLDFRFVHVASVLEYFTVGAGGDHMIPLEPFCPSHGQQVKVNPNAAVTWPEPVGYFQVQPPRDLLKPVKDVVNGIRNLRKGTFLCLECIKATASSRDGGSAEKENAPCPHN